MNTPSLLPSHEHELIVGSGIDPAIAAARGCRSVTAEEAKAIGFASNQCRDGLLLPEWTLAGKQLVGRLKPDAPRLNDKGKPIKYEAPTGSAPCLDIHPESRHVLRDASIPLWFTEGVKKADSAWSRGQACVSLPGVWMFLHGRLVAPDLDEIALDGRRVLVVFDSDVTRKPEVAEALLRFCEALRRRGASVSVAYLPEGESGAKVGLDDFFVGGGTVADVEALAIPWDGKGPGVWVRERGEASPELLQPVVSALMQAIENPEVSRAQLSLMAAVAGLVMHKRAAGAVAPDGSVRLTAAEISDDWRAAPERGQRIEPTNPSGTKPRMARERVGAMMAESVERGLIDASPIPVVKRHANGSVYKATDWAIAVPAAFVDLIAPYAHYRPDAPKIRKPRSVPKPCPSCGERHPLTRRDYCAGCGALVAETTVEPESASDNLSDDTSMGAGTGDALASDKTSEATSEPEASLSETSASDPSSAPARPIRLAAASVGPAVASGRDPWAAFDPPPRSPWDVLDPSEQRYAWAGVAA